MIMSSTAGSGRTMSKGRGRQFYSGRGIEQWQLLLEGQQGSELGSRLFHSQDGFCLIFRDLCLTKAVRKVFSNLSDIVATDNL